MASVVRSSPNSLVVRTAYDEMQKRAAASAGDKVKSKLRGLIKRPG